MALVKYGGGVTQMSGRIGGDVHARNSTSNYIRAGTKPINPNTARQIVVRSLVAELTARWGATLTAVQRTAWNLYAASVAMKNRLAETIYLSGFNHYVRSNVFRMQGGMAVVDAGPVIFELPAHDPAFNVSISEATQQITTTYDDTMDWNNETGGGLWCYMGSPQNAQRSFFNGPWRYCGGLNGVTGAPPASPQVLACSFVASEGQHIWVSARLFRADGRLSEKFFFDTFCLA